MQLGRALAFCTQLIAQLIVWWKYAAVGGGEGQEWYDKWVWDFQPPAALHSWLALAMHEVQNKQLMTYI